MEFERHDERFVIFREFSGTKKSDQIRQLLVVFFLERPFLPENSKLCRELVFRKNFGKIVEQKRLYLTGSIRKMT